MAILGAVSLPVTAFATFTETVNAGYLYSTPFPSVANGNIAPGKLNSGALLLLIAAGSGNGQTFTPTPAAGQYVGGGDTILGSSSFNTGLGTGGGTSGNGQATQSFFSALPQTTNTNVYIELRWYPSITLAQYQAGMVPTAGMAFGAYNPLATNASGNTTLNPDGDSAWVQQTSSGSFTVDLYTSDFTVAPKHTQMPSEGYANFVVPVPEPSAGTLGGLGLVVMVGAARFWRRAGCTRGTPL